MGAKLLEATLVKPTSHKERKLDELLSTYRETLRTAFTNNANTPDRVRRHLDDADPLFDSAEAAIVKDAAQRIQNGATLDDEEPLRAVNPSVVLDRDSNREHTFCWQVPHDDPFWIPIETNPMQDDYWHGVLDGEYVPVKLELQRHSRNWVLRVAVEKAVEPVEPPEAIETSSTEEHLTTDDPSRRPIGVDIGETALVTGCALATGDKPIDPLMVDGRQAKHLRKEMYTTLNRLDKRDAADWRIRERFTSYRNTLTDIIETASRRIVDYAKQFDEPVLVMEDLDVGGEHLRDAMFQHRRLNMWSFNHLQRRIAEKANDSGIPVAFVEPEYTSQTCHQCNHLGVRDDTFACTNPECWVSTYQSDINAAAVIAKRYDPWGETCRLKPDGDDSPRDGSPRDGATVSRERGDNLERTSRNHDAKTSPAGHWLFASDADAPGT